MQKSRDGADEALKSAKNCRHYAMCKIDFLGTGVCASGVERGFVSFYPQGRMALYTALAEGTVTVTEQAVQIADSCNLCGKCDYQCYFVTGMRPSLVMKALKELVASRMQEKAALEAPPEDRLLRELRAVVGPQWATGDRAVAVTYASDPSPLSPPKMPRYVVMPSSREEIAAVVRLLGAEQVPWTVRANGTNILGFTLGTGAILDMNRMKEIVFDEKNWLVRIGPGVTSFDLQTEAVKRGYRVNVAEPAAAVCGSLMCTGILSLFATAYGTAADNFVDAEFVACDGSFFSLNQKESPNLFAFSGCDQPSPGICYAAKVKLHPRLEDESGVLVPFRDLEQALVFSKECALRRLGTAIGLLGVEYVSSFISPTQALAMSVKDALQNKLGISYLVLVIGDRFALDAVTRLGYPLLDQHLFRTINLGLSNFGSARFFELLTELSQEEPFSYLTIKGFSELAQTALAPGPEHLVQGVDADLRAFFQELYSRPELTDLVWLSMFRITSSRIGREKHFFPIIIFLPLEHNLIAQLCREFRQIAERLGLKNELGFITPIDGGKRCILEYDYFLDHTDDRESSLLRLAAQEAGAVIEEYALQTGTIRWLRHVLYQGYCRKENLLYA